MLFLAIFEIMRPRVDFGFLDVFILVRVELLSFDMGLGAFPFRSNPYMLLLLAEFEKVRPWIDLALANLFISISIELFSLDEALGLQTAWSQPHSSRIMARYEIVDPRITFDRESFRVVLLGNFKRCWYWSSWANPASILFLAN